MIAISASAFFLIFAARAAVNHPSYGIGLFYLIPVSLLALRFGLSGGMVAALVATGLYCGWSVLDDDGMPAVALISRSLMFFMIGGIVGYLSRGMLAALSRFDVALKAAPILVFTTDIALRYTWTHHTWSGRTDAPMVGRTDIEILGPDQGKPAQDLKLRALAVGGAVHDVYDIVDPEGARRWFSVTVEPLRDSSGKITGLTGAALDVTPELSATQALERSEARFRAAAENQLEPFALYSPVRGADDQIIDFCCEFINSPGAASVGMNREHMVGKRLSELFPGRLESGLLGEYAKVVETGQPMFREAIDYINVLGEETLVRAFDIRVSKLDSGIQVTWRDITDRVRAERERDWIQALVERSPDAIMSVDLHGRIVSWSAGSERMYGYAPEEVIGQPFTMLFEEAELAARRERMGRLFEGESIGPLTVTERRKDGSSFEAEYTAAPIFDSDGVVIGAARIVREQQSEQSAPPMPADPPTHHKNS
ncbi:MAG: PAS domain S-box protein [Thermoleophilaceae bacterium]|nr:PAS domain S-box protein [Thermoleophilaceae bacterium]